jgi:hypothetical protein
VIHMSDGVHLPRLPHPVETQGRSWTLILTGLDVGDTSD